MEFTLINLEKTMQDIKRMSDDNIIKKYKLRCCFGRTAPWGLKEDGSLYIHGDYIKILVTEIKERNLYQYLLEWDLKKS